MRTWSLTERFGKLAIKPYPDRIYKTFVNYRPEPFQRIYLGIFTTMGNGERYR